MLVSTDISADVLVRSLIELSKDGRRISVLDSCGVGHLGSHLLIAGIGPVETVVLRGSADDTLRSLEEQLDRGLAAIFTISYDFGLKLQGIRSRHDVTDEPDVCLALFDSLIIHDYATGSTSSSGRENGKDIFDLLADGPLTARHRGAGELSASGVQSNMSRDRYLGAVETIKERIRRGDTYQTNLTQTLSVSLNNGDDPGEIFTRLRRDHPAPFGAFIDRGDSHVISASPERFFKIAGNIISTSPIKGTRPRGRDPKEDERLRNELRQSEKDRAENTMIVDLLRNDLGRVCEYGSVEVKTLCDLEEHPTLFHLVSTVEGRLRNNVTFAEILAALFPCGSITGAPKIRTMQIIDELEPSARGLSMGAIGFFIPDTGFVGMEPGFELSVAIRTMVIRDGVAAFNVGGGVTIESDSQAEYEESLLKAKALLTALGNK